MTDNHQPGPWSMHHGRLVDAQGRPVLLTGNSGIGFGSGFNHPERAANDALVRAAPDLLDACEQALHLHEPDEGISDLLISAIAKARGEQE